MPPANVPPPVIAPRSTGLPRPVRSPVSDRPSEKAMLTPAPRAVAAPVKNAVSGWWVASTTANIGARVDSDPSISPLSAGWTRLSRNDWLSVVTGEVSACVIVVMSESFLSWVTRSWGEGGDREQAQDREQDREGQHRREGPGEPGQHAHADHGNDQAGVARHEEGGDGMTSPFGWGQAVGGGQAAQEDGADGDPSYHRSGQEQGHRGLGQGGDDQGQPGQEQAQAGQHHPAAAEPRQRDLGDGPHREQQEHHGSLDGMAALMQLAGDEARHQRTEQPEQRESGESGHAGGDELTPAPLRDA